MSLHELENTVDTLVTVAQELLDLARRTPTADFTPLQDEQETLVAKAHALKEKLGAEPLPEAIVQKLTTFARLNTTFMTNIRVQAGLAQNELNEIQKARKSLAGVKQAYGTARHPKRERKRIDAIS